MICVLNQLRNRFLLIRNLIITFRYNRLRTAFNILSYFFVSNYDKLRNTSDILPYFLFQKLQLIITCIRKIFKNSR
jgi:hypothetical protein